MEAIGVVILLCVAVYFFFKHSTAAQHKSLPIEQDWVQPFIQFYVANEMRLAVDGTLPDTIRALAAGLTNETQVQQSMLVALQRYLSFSYSRDRMPADWSLAAIAGRDFLQAELRTLNSPIALRRFVRRNAEGNISESELSAEVAAIATEIRKDDELALHIRNEMLKDSVEELFEATHAESIRTYAAKLLAHQEALMA